MTCTECGRELTEETTIILELYDRPRPTQQIRSACCWGLLASRPIPPLRRVPPDIQDAIGAGR